MKQPHRKFLLPLSCLLSWPLLGQTQIGGGICNSSSLNGVYAITLTGRQVTAAGTFTNVFQANGAVTFDGQSKVTMQLTTDSLRAAGSPVTYSGAYSVQANCAGLVNIATGDTATFNLLIYNQGRGFLLTGSDATYNFTGGGSGQPAATCTLPKLAGVYSLNATGYDLSNGAVNGVGDGAGLIQFDGKGSITVNFSLSTAGAPASVLTLSGTYSLGASCLGSTSLTDSKGAAYVMAISVTGSSAAAITGFDVILAQSSKFIVSGAGHALFGQPTAAVTGGPADTEPAIRIFAAPRLALVLQGEQA
jgi:hypothetical protein